MKLDVLSMILGGILWEVGATYIHFVAKPAFIRWKYRLNGKKPIVQRQGKEIDYKETAMGFNCSLRKEVE